MLQGTVIRVFSIPQGEKLFEFRRGMKRYDGECFVTKNKGPVMFDV